MLIQMISWLPFADILHPGHFSPAQFQLGQLYLEFSETIDRTRAFEL